MKQTLQDLALSVVMMTAAAHSFAQETATVTQSGHSNVASIDRNGGASADAEVAQYGDGNRAAVTQLHADSGTPSVFVRQGGNLNTASIDQDGDAGAATALQAGDRNQLAMTQGSASSASLGVTQIGLEDGARVNQFNVVGANLYLEQHNGIGNVAAISQHDGSGLSVFSIQGGNYHLATIDQAGTNADLYTDQEGSQNTLAVRQDLLLQERPMAYSNTIQQSGSLNAATLTQVGRDFSAAIRQSAAGNTATINQHY